MKLLKPRTAPERELESFQGPRTITILISWVRYGCGDTNTRFLATAFYSFNLLIGQTCFVHFDLFIVYD